VTTKTIYEGYYLAPMAAVQDDGSYQARIAVVMLAGDRTRSQSFLDFGLFPTRAQADAHAVEQAKEWVDAAIRMERYRPVRAARMNRGATHAPDSGSAAHS
jgi:hypothetical protein